MAYAKALVAILSGVIMTVAAAISDQTISSVEWVQIAIAGATAASVWLAGHLPTGLVWPKTAMAALLAILNLLVTMVATHHSLTPAEWVNLAIAGLTAVGVQVAPTRPSPQLAA